VFSHPDDISTARRILIYEMDDVASASSTASPKDPPGPRCARALEIIHADEHGANRERACLDSYYECLRTFYNQWHHDRLDRTLVILFPVASAQEGVALPDRWARPGIWDRGGRTGERGRRLPRLAP
jgi:hypothetical protein